MADWTLETVAERFAEAARTAHGLPPVRVQGYFNTWPAIVRQEWERYASKPSCYRFPPGPDQIERMQETMRWVQWLSVEQRHLVWMRAEGHEWQAICRRFGCERTTAWRRWQRALGIVAVELNGQASQ